MVPLRQSCVYDSIPRQDKHGNRIARRLAVVLPLRLQVGSLPMPFIVDTGIPSTVYVGTNSKAVAILKKLDSIQ